MIESEQEYLLEKLHRTWIQFLLDNDWRDYAAIIIDADLEWRKGWDQYYNESYITGLCVHIPNQIYTFYLHEDNCEKFLSETFKIVARGHIWDDMSEFPITYIMQLIDVEEDWQNTIKFSQ